MRNHLCRHLMETGDRRYTRFQKEKDEGGKWFRGVRERDGAEEVLVGVLEAARVGSKLTAVASHPEMSERASRGSVSPRTTSSPKS
jgi:hypothetical protein